jgi:hypothetical protein
MLPGWSLAQHPQRLSAILRNHEPGRIGPGIQGPPDQVNVSLVIVDQQNGTFHGLKM